MSDFPSPLNPYAPPAQEIQAISISPGSEGLAFRDGSDLMVKSGATLPGVCPFTGKAAPEGSPVYQFGLGWSPWWFYLVTLILPAYFGLAYLSRWYAWASFGKSPWPGIVAMWSVMWAFTKARKNGQATGFRSRKIRRFNLGLKILSATLALIGAALLLSTTIGSLREVEFFSSSKINELFLEGGFGALGLAFLPLFFRRRLRVKSYRDGWFRVRNCHHRFLERLPTAPR